MCIGDRAKAPRMDRSRLRYLHDDRLNQIQSPLARAQLGAALYMIGDNARAKSAFDSAEPALGSTNTGDYYPPPPRYLAGVLSVAHAANHTTPVPRLAPLEAQSRPVPARAQPAW